MARPGGISGLGVALAASGVFLVYAGIRDVPVLDGLRALLRGQAPEGRPATGDVSLPDALRFGRSASGTIGGGGGGGIDENNTVTPASGPLAGRIAAEAATWDGKVRYKWGGNDPNGWDCSGFVTYVLRKVGLTLPGRPTTATYQVWKGATNIRRSECAAGDLVVYFGVPGHIGIALSNAEMIHAPTFGQNTKRARIYGTPTIRRVKGT